MTEPNSAMVGNNSQVTKTPTRSRTTQIDFQGPSASQQYNQSYNQHSSSACSTKRVEIMPPGYPNLKPGQKEAQEKAAREHQELMNQLDIAAIPKPFKNPNWKPGGRRNKTIKMIIAAEEAARVKEANALANNESGAITPANEDTEMSGVEGDDTPAPSANNARPANLHKAALEKSLKTEITSDSNDTIRSAPLPTYMNIEAGPSMRNAKKYCDITGLEGPYTDPKTRLRYHNMEVAGVIKTLGPGVAEQYLEARGAHTILK